MDEIEEITQTTPMSGTLYIVATPIGNMEDMTFRAVRMLEQVDAIACEDTRVTVKILERYKLPHKPLTSLHHHSGEGKVKEVIDAMLSGQSFAYVTDAGTPGMNDPGGKLVEQAFAAGISVVPIPGASVLTTAISSCGFPMEKFSYVGFLPHKKGRSTLIKEIAGRDDVTVFLESTHRIEKAMEELVAALDPERVIYVGRELTKKFETHLRGTAAEVQAMLGKGSAKGEFIVIIGPR
jgi:16S rRNA (cytidine1402-2'-O)-methyltransferase